MYIALKRLVEAENLDAIAIRCWPELPRDYGQWPYLAVTRLADEGLPVACEGDVDGALTMLCCKFFRMRCALHLGLARARPVVVRVLARRHVPHMPDE